MTKIKLTDRYISSFRPPENGRVSLVDGICPGLHLRITRQGTKSFSVICRVTGKLVRQTLGEYPALSLASARREAQRIQRDAAHPAAVMAPPVQVAQAGTTFGELVTSYVDMHLKPNTRSWANVAATLRQDALKPFSERDAAGIGKTDVVAVLDQMVKASQPHAAANVLRAVRAMYNWGAGRGTVQVNPFDGMRPPVATTMRDRMLSNAEIAAVLRACDDVPRPFGDLVRVLLHTGARRNEVAEMEWAELDGDVWTLPAARSKSGRANSLPLPPAVLAVLEAQRQHSDGKGFVFTTSGGARPSSDFSKRKRLLDEASGTSGWRLHDLRRTARSKLAELGVPREVARRIVGHSVDRLDEVYDRFSYLEPKREALANLAEHFERLNASIR
jgi:integrase